MAAGFGLSTTSCGAKWGEAVGQQTKWKGWRLQQGSEDENDICCSACDMDMGNA